jgi:(p)ppGpp synthase/HD superfamily hydrolase
MSKNKKILPIKPDLDFVYEFSYNFSDRQKKLIEYVKEQHNFHSKSDKKSVRKYTIDSETGIGIPYWVHTVEVAETVAEYVPEGIEIALCHDLFEDTWCNFDNLFNALRDFGYEPDEASKICLGVVDLTDVYESENYPEMNRAERKEKEAIRLGKVSELSQSVKYADLLNNSKNIVEKDEKFAMKYLPEKLVILNHMRKGDINLFVDCCWVLKNGMDKLGIGADCE